MKRKGFLLGLVVLAFSMVLLALWVEQVRAQEPGIVIDVTLAWDANTEADLAGYKLYWSQTAQNYNTDDSIAILTTSLADAANPQFEVLGLPVTQALQGWYFVATAFDTEGLESGWSNEVYAAWDGVTGIPPQPPGLLRTSKIVIHRPDGSVLLVIETP